MSDGIDREAVARAIWESPLVDQPPGFERRAWPPKYPGVRGEYLVKADAAISAVLEQLQNPSDGMLYDAMDELDDAHRCRVIWRAMLAAANPRSPGP